MCSKGLWAGRPGFESRQAQELFLYSTGSRPALGPTQPPIQYVTSALSLGVKRPGSEADHSHLVPKAKTVELYLHSSIRFNSVVLHSLSTGTTLPFMSVLINPHNDIFLFQGRAIVQAASRRLPDRLCGLVVKVPGYRFRGPGSIPGATRFFWEVVGLERGPLSLVFIN
jgi:hypothetical protein